MTDHSPSTASGPTSLGRAAPPSPGVTRAARSPAAILLFLTVCLGTLVGDLALKHWAFGHVAGVPVELTRRSGADPHFWSRYPHDPIVLLPHVLSLRLTTNTGAVFGLGKGGQWFFIVVSVLAVGVIGAVFLRHPASAWWRHVALALVLAGALGNLYDRLCFNAVRDMLWLFPTTSLWPWIFNLADAALVTGVSMLVLAMLRAEWRLRTGGSGRG